jgi:predicted DCC family thiol-disulfide oxidoreductase YuxK
MKATVIYDSDCGLCTRVKGAVEALDWLGTMRWIPLSSAEAVEFGIPREQLERSVYLVSGAARTRGWSAVKRMLARLPLTYLAGGALAFRSPWSAAGLALLFTPAFNPLGDGLYDWVARNRNRLPASTCAATIWDNEEK